MGTAPNLRDISAPYNSIDFLRIYHHISYEILKMKDRNTLKKIPGST